MTRSASEIRIDKEIQIYYGQTQKLVLSGFSFDVSNKGLYLKTELPLKIDDELNLIFSLPGQNKSIKCKARVAWVNSVKSPLKPELPPGVGVQFINLPEDTAIIMREFMENHKGGMSP